MVHETDVVVIGAGPIGLFSIFECGMMRLRCHVIDALDHIGGQCIALYPEKPIYDIPAYPMVTGAALIENLEKQATPFQPTYHLGHQVTHLEAADDEGKLWVVKTNNGIEIRCKAIIIAAGVGAFGPNRPPLDDIEHYEGTSILYHVRNRDLFRNKRVVIAGGGDSAVDWALSISEIADRVMVVHRRAKFRAAPESELRLNQLAENGKIDLVVPYQLEALQGDGKILAGVVVKTLNGEERTLETDYLLPFFGLSMNLGPIASWGLGLSHFHVTIDPLTGSTNRPGVYAIGDIATYAHKQKLILTGFAEAAQAAQHVRRFLYPEEVLHFEYSTTKGIPEMSLSN
jgi:thioredoxin reductase (NADPH)